MSDLEKLNKDPKFREYMSKEEDTRKCHNTEFRIARESGITEGILKGTKEANIEIVKKC